MAHVKKMDRPTLLSLRKEANEELYKFSMIKLDEDDVIKGQQTARITQVQGNVDHIDIALGELPADLNTSLVGESHGYDLNRIVMGIRSALDKVGGFRPSGLINQFCNRVSPVHKMYVSGKLAVHPTLEQEFTSMVVCLLPFSSQNKFAEEATWDALQKKLKIHFQADISIFQWLSKVWAFQSNLTGVKWSDQSVQLTSTLSESKANIKSHFLGKGKNLSCDDTFSLIGAMIMAESVKANSPEVHRLMLDSLDSCSSSEDVAKKAAFYSDRISDEHTPSFLVKVDRAAKTNQQPRQLPKVHKKSDQSRASKELVRECIKKKLCIKYNHEGCHDANCRYKHEFADIGKGGAVAMPAQVANWSEDIFDASSF